MCQILGVNRAIYWLFSWFKGKKRPTDGHRRVLLSPFVPTDYWATGAEAGVQITSSPTINSGRLSWLGITFTTT